MAEEKRGWEPLSPCEAADLFREANFPWWIAGGWALDLHLGRQTRSHRDTDLGVLRLDQHLARSALTGWDVSAAEDGQLTSIPASDDVPAGANSLWCRSTRGGPWQLQLMLDEGDRETWVYRRDPRVTRPLGEAISRDPADIPHLVPEIQLLYKAPGMRPEDLADFESVLPTLSVSARVWLGRALTIAHPEHTWLDRLGLSAR